MIPPKTADELIAYLTARAAQIRDLRLLRSECVWLTIPCPTIELLMESTCRDTERAAAACLAGLQP